MNKIPEAAFSLCRKLKSVKIPASVKTIEFHAFFACESLKRVELPETLRVLENQSFQSSGLTSIVVPGSVKTVGAWAFTQCSKLKTVIIEEGVKKVGKQAFHQCRSLKAILIPGSVKKIDYHAVGFKSQYVRYGITKIYGYKKTAAQKWAKKNRIPFVALKKLGKPGKGSVKNVKGGKIAVKWKKSANVEGYEIQYADNAAFTGKKTVKAPGAKTTKKTISLKTGKTYYVRVRGYKKVSGLTYYSAWSGKKQVTVKK